MTTFINVQTRDEFDDFLTDLKRAEHMAVDSETNGLRWYSDHEVISFSCYFPEYDTAYNIPFKHGYGKVDVDYNENNSAITLFSDMSWQGKAKKQLYLSYWFQQYSQVRDFGNIPTEWLEEIKPYWTQPVHYYHNALFDLHMMNKLGFPTPTRVRDTLVMLHIVNEDWGGIRVNAPFIWTEADRKKGNCRKEDVGRWAKTNTGALMTREQQGNRQLKWQSAFSQLEDATSGEDSLFTAIKKLEDELADYAHSRLNDPYNEGLVYKTEKSRVSSQQYERLREKIELDSKANLWMLPSHDVAYYAMLDVVLTWKLHEKWLPTVRAWDNLQLYDDLCETLMLSWEVERNGALLDVDAAKAEIERIDPLVMQVQAAVNQVAHDIGYGADVNLGSPKQLLAFLNWENDQKKAVLEIPMGMEVMPDFYQTDERMTGITTYENARPTTTERDKLEEFDGHPLVMLVLEYRKLKKSSDTYLKNWLKARDANGYVHAGMNSTGTVAGRWSSSGDAGNWQNIPDRNGYKVKNALISPPNWLVIGLDYGQLEARLAADIAEHRMVEWGVHNLEPMMSPRIDADIHSFTRDTLDVRNVVYPNMTDREVVIYLGYDDEGDEKNAKVVAKTCRYIAKTLNFGLLYNGTEYMASKLLKIDLETAKVLVDRWKALFPVFSIAQKYYNDLALTWRDNPTSTGQAMYVTQPISNRHRKLHKYAKWAQYFEDGVRKTFNPQQASAKKVWNNVVQGLGGYICTMSGVTISKKYGSDMWRPFAQIHDAWDGYINLDNLHIVKDMMHIMTDWDTNPRLTVELAASVDGTWQNMVAVKDVDLWIDSRGTKGYA